jgi:hypothetical protein
MEIAMNTSDDRSESSRRGKRAVAKATPIYPIFPAPLRFRVAEAISSADFVAVTLFSAIGLLATLNLILRIPDFGVM